MVTAAEIRKAVESLKTANIEPKCSNHDPFVRLINDEYGVMVVCHCDNCGLTVCMHPDSYLDMMNGEKMVNLPI